ncbi:iron complex transport system substrate-binding protein [Streptococcus gallinaceus]|uniref:siderophore ABC transporter substrate-binding protein n=1 Tax=Streptococcus gallinaceus TaxID=165758 RepID=UPI00209ECC0C|nr:ABC transporter substrate-binding protein [Streptococcus gallinaceus]MCP1640223.1 iron complex transport system substrate-binding protein [Streptococcus gallinaceus]MCP1770993.1 iron complex transport system substrate-binding protein [Streptococcus gallinaceus]
MKKKLATVVKVILMSVLTVGLVACASKKTAEKEKPAAQEITLTDASGQVTLKANPKKIVVLDNGVADSIRALGFEDTIVGMPKDTLPAYLKDFKNKKSITNVGNLKEVNMETLAELAPDLIIASGRTADKVAEFKKIAPTIYFATDKDKPWASIKGNIQELAKLFGEKGQEKAKKSLAKLDKKVEKVAKANQESQKKALTVLLNEGAIAAIPATGRYGLLYKDLGFKATEMVVEDAAKAGKHGAMISFEGIHQLNPDLIFVVDRSLAIGSDHSKNESALKNDLVQATNAGKNKGIVSLTADLWYLSGGGLESTELMIDEVAAYAGK